MSDGTVEREVVERGEGRVEGAGVVGVGVQEAGGRVVFAFGRRQVSFEEVLERIRAKTKERRKRYLALVRVSNAPIFFACSAFCFCRLVIFSSCRPFVLTSSAVCAWSVLRLELRLSRMWDSW